MWTFAGRELSLKRSPLNWNIQRRKEYEILRADLSPKSTDIFRLKRVLDILFVI